MSALLRLYPRAWRERYGDEMLALLEAQPASIFDQLDLILGALDAHLHEQVRGSAEPDKESPVSPRTFGLLAIIGGLAWTIGVLTALVLPPDPYGDPDTTIARIGAFVGASLMGVALGELGTRLGSAGSYTGHVIGLGSVILGLTLLMPWPWFPVGLIGFPLLASLAGVRAYQNGRLPGWYAAFLVAASVAAIAGAFGLATTFVLVALVGPMGMMLGLLIAVRPAAPTAPAKEPA